MPGLVPREQVKAEEDEVQLGVQRQNTGAQSQCPSFGLCILNSALYSKSHKIYRCGMLFPQSSTYIYSFMYNILFLSCLFFIIFQIKCTYMTNFGEFVLVFRQVDKKSQYFRSI